MRRLKDEHFVDGKREVGRKEGRKEGREGGREGGRDRKRTPLKSIH